MYGWRRSNTCLAEKIDQDPWEDPRSGDSRPLFEALVGRPGPDFGLVGRLCDRFGRVLGPTGLLGRLWAQIRPMWGPFRGRPTFKNRAPALAGARFLPFRPKTRRPCFRPTSVPYLGPIRGCLGPRPGPPWGFLGSPGGPDLARRGPRRGLMWLLGAVLGHGRGFWALSGAFSSSLGPLSGLLSGLFPCTIGAFCNPEALHLPIHCARQNTLARTTAHADPHAVLC